MLVERRKGELHVRPNPVRKKTTTLIYGERLVLSEVEGLVLKARPEGSRTMVIRIGSAFMGEQ